MYVESINTSLLSRRPLPVFITRVESPTLMWVQLQYNRVEVKELEEELRWHMEHRQDRYQLLPYAVTSGAQVAVRSNRHWYRGTIETVHKKANTVFLGDWGRSIRVPIQSLRILPDQFCIMPWQAIPCGLNEIRPVGEETFWSSKTRALTKALAQEEDANMIIKRAVGTKAADTDIVMYRKNQIGGISLKRELIRLGKVEHTTNHNVRPYPSI